MRYKSSNNKLSPVVLFVYNRLWHTEKTIEALRKNTLAKETELFIYSDAPKDDYAKSSVDEVRQYIKKIEGFKKVVVVEREKNWGLASSIIDGVTEVVNRYGKVIVMEDDLVVSPYFLKFMNDALDFYENKKKVWHISGWNYPIKIDNKNDVFLWRVMNCWGWATWANRWQFYEKDVEKVVNMFSKNDIKKFNLDGEEDFWVQIILNKFGLIDTWATFWYAVIFSHGGLCVNPVQSFVQNIGMDGSGMHCKKSEQYKEELFLDKETFRFSVNSREDYRIVQEIKYFYRNQQRSLVSTVAKIISRFFVFLRMDKYFKVSFKKD